LKTKNTIVNIESTPRGLVERFSSILAPAPRRGNRWKSTLPFCCFSEWTQICNFK